MAHKFDRTSKDPYSEAEHQVTGKVYSSRDGEEAGASEEIFTALATSIVTSLGDIGAQAFRHGLNQPQQIRGLAHAVAAVAETVLTGYLGEVDPEPVLQALESDPRTATLAETPSEELQREIGKTRQLEHLILSARRLPELLNLAGELGLHVPDDVVDNSPLLVPGSMPTGPGTQQGIGITE